MEPSLDKPPALLAENAGLTVSAPAGPIEILAGASLSVSPGEAVAVVGPSGSGKSSLLALLAGLDRPTSGRIMVMGEDLSTLDEEGRASVRRRCLGIVFQAFHLVPTLTAEENVSVPLELGGMGTREARSRARAALEEVGLAGRRGHRPAALSGGEQQRVALARALAKDPAASLADEPTGSLDAATGEAVADLLFARRAARGAALLLVTHDPALAARADRMVRMRAGRLVA
jgi:putative ABC transport system ATP-binding protein